MTKLNLKSLNTRNFVASVGAANDHPTYEMTMTVEEAMIRGRRLHAEAMAKTLRAAFGWLGQKPAALLRMWRQARRESIAIAELLRLDDATLRDIGIHHRSQIASIVGATVAASSLRGNTASAVAPLKSTRVEPPVAPTDRAA